MRTATRRWCAAAAAILLLAADAPAQRDARRFGALLEELVAARRWQDAEQLVAAHARRTRELRTDVTELAATEFHVGWFWAERARASDLDPERARAARQRSVHAYRSVLQLVPGSTQATLNLAFVLQELGAYERAADVLTQPIEAGTAKKPNTLRLALGDVYLRQDRFEDAWRIYEELAKGPPDDARTELAAHERLIGLYASAPAEFVAPRHGTLVDYCRRLDALGLERLASRGMAKVVQRAHAVDRAATEEALETWIDQRIRLGRLDREALRQLPTAARLDSPPLAHLERLVEAGPDALEDDAYWTETRARRELASNTLRLRGETLEWQGSPDAALANYEAAFSVAPSLETYGRDDLRDRTAPKLQAAVPLAALLHRLESDRDSASPRLETVLQEIDRSARAGTDVDPAGARQVHETIGMIRHQQNDAARSIEQLELAVSAEATLALREGRPPSVRPGVHVLLAEGYERTDQPEKSVEHRLDAGRLYLEQGNPRAAGDVLREAERTETRPDRRRDLEDVRHFSEALEQARSAPRPRRPDAWTPLLRDLKTDAATNDPKNRWKATVARRYLLQDQRRTLDPTEAKKLGQAAEELKTRYRLE